MRTMLLSLREDVYKRVLSGEKIYEHRKVFPDEPVKAYIYVSKPMKAICGIMYLSNKTSLMNWKEMYRDDSECIKRIDEYLPHHKFGMEINRFENTNSIPLDKLRKDLTKFIVPQMYYFIENSELLSYLETYLKPDGIVVTHTYENVTSDMICKS
jgi:predicted transcriptional regulator